MIKENIVLRLNVEKTYSVGLKNQNTQLRRKMLSATTGKTYLPMAIRKEICKVAVGDDLGKCFGIKMIYFDLNKSNIRAEAALI
jgi:hypothetical protein